MKCLKAVFTLGAAGASILFPLGVSAQAPELPDGPGKAFVSENCTGCHASELITAQRRTPEEWGDVVSRMIANGDSLTEDQYKEVVTYLGTYLGKTSAAGAAPAPAGAGSDAASSAQTAHHTNK